MTDIIGQKIDAIQGDTAAAVKAIEEVGRIIAQVNDIATVIASAVEEQTATTNEISLNVTEAVQGTADIAQNIAGVADAARESAAGATRSQQAAAALSQMAADLQMLVSRFSLNDDSSQIDVLGLPSAVTRRDDKARRSRPVHRTS